MAGDVLSLEGLDPAVAIAAGGKFAGDRIVIEYTRANTFNTIGLMIDYRTGPQRQRFQKTLLFPGFAQGGRAVIDLSGLPFPKHAIEQVHLFFIGRQESVHIRAIAIETLSAWQRALAPWRRFWEMDAFEPHTINHLYGPRSESGSATPWLLAILALFTLPALAAAAVFSHRRDRGRKKIAFAFAGVMVMAAVAFYDLRMTLEFTQYARENYEYWVAAPYPYKNYKKVYLNLPLFADWAKEQFETHGVATYRFHCPHAHFRSFFAYQVYPATPGDDPQALVVWDARHRIHPDNVVSYGKDQSFRFSRRLDHPLIDASAMFIAETPR